MRPPGFAPPGFPGPFPTQEPQQKRLQRPHPGALDGVPVGAIVAFPGDILQQTDQYKRPGTTDLNMMPWMICDGSSLKVDEYPDLFAVLGTMYGSDDDQHFNLPDYRGYFLRGVDPQKKRDQDKRDPPAHPGALDNGPGTTQTDALRDHEHDLNWGSGVMAGENGAEVIMSGSAQTGDIYTENGVNVSEYETRAMNIAVNWLIKTR